jgi:tRNA-specific 2-thiouridylase
MKKQKVLVGMSGGVDSSVAALLLQKQGYEVIGGFMKNWSNDECGGKGKDITECEWRSEQRDAARVASKLGIEFHTFDFEKEYRKEVYEYMLNEYQSGRTPNPDMLCNKYMKFGHFLEKAKELGCEFVATGHYARVKHYNEFSRLFAGKDKNKDQSYFLARLTQGQLKHCLFPIGDLKKSKVRKIAAKHDLHVANKKDSQGICFVGKVALSDFLGTRIKSQEGIIVDTKGNILGKHEGHAFYTIGQRHGLNLGGTDPYFVVERRPNTNEVVVGHESDPALYRHELDATDIIETRVSIFNKMRDSKVKARIRYRQKLQKCKFSIMKNNDLRVMFKHPQRAVAPGQFIVFYCGKEVIGSGVIK